MAGRRLIWLLALAGCGVFFAAYQEWFSWVLLLWVAVVPIAVLGLSLPAMLSVRTAAEVPARLLRGEQAPAELGIWGRKGLPIPAVKAKLRLTRQLNGEKLLLSPGDPLPTEHCGGFTVQPCRAWVCDYLGIFSIRPKTETRTLLVLPRPEKPERVPDVSRFLARAWTPKPGGGYSENHDLRPYRPGDSLNQVHWKLSAKTGQLMLREPMEPRRGRMLVTLDVKNDLQKLDRELGQLLWLGNFLLEQGLAFETAALTGAGLEVRRIENETQLRMVAEALLLAPAGEDGSVRDRQFEVSWQYDIGGDADEG